MTVNDLLSRWLHNRDPNAEVKVWDLAECDYIFTKNCLPLIETEETSEFIIKLGNSTVSSFDCWYINEYKREVLMININKLGE